jgi:Rieske 2Fe-2S family protein
MAMISERAPMSNGLTRAEPTLPSAWYFDPAHYARELQGIWYRSWIYLCRASALDGPLAFRTFTIGDQTIILLRDEAGALQAFHNTCRHRGSLLQTEPAGRLRARALTCPYHAWTYGLDGALLRMPSKLCAADFDRGAHSLYRIAIAEWKGFVFINLDEQAAAFDPTLDLDDSASLDNWPLGDLVSGHMVRKVVACNWKIFWENYNECLHCPNAHPELSDIVPIYSRGLLEPADHPDWQTSTDPKLRGGLKAGAASWAMDGQAAPHVFPDLTEAERAAGQSYATRLPSVYLVAHVDYVRAVRVMPLGPDSTELTAEWLFPRETLEDPRFDLKNTTDFATLVMTQDAALCELNQRGLHSLRHHHGTLMPEEYLVQQFHDWVRTALEARS